MFTDLSNQKEIEVLFDYLSEDQVYYLQEFLGSIKNENQTTKEQFLRIWKSLKEVYHHFNAQLEQHGIAYTGALHKEVCSRIESLTPETLPVLLHKKEIVFAGFNALTLAEEKVISFFVKDFNAKVFWDADTYYVRDVNQEAGIFLREYKKQHTLSSTFKNIPENFLKKKDNNKGIQLLGFTQPVSQAKHISVLIQNALEYGIPEDQIVVVLPDEKLLIPVLNSIPDAVQHVNITMGYGLSQTPIFSLFECLLDLQLKSTNEFGNHQVIMQILLHPYIMGIAEKDCLRIQKEIINNNQLQINWNFWEDKSEIFKLIFRKAAINNFHQYVLDVCLNISKHDSIGNIDKEFLFHFFTVWNKVSTFLEQDINNKLSTDSAVEAKQWKSLHRFIKQFIQTEKIPFAGEPLKGLQVMGVLETRNLDYQYVIMLSLNEGVLPSGSQRGTYIPFNLRKAYLLPTPEHQDAMYAYLFYRILQRAERITLLYTTQADKSGQGELSRFVQQLLFESGWNIQHEVIETEVRIPDNAPIFIEKNNHVMEQVWQILEGTNPIRKGLSPSGFTTYLECSLKFYFRQIAGIKLPKEVEEDIDNRVLGNLLHLIMEKFYEKLQKQSKSNVITADLLATNLKDLNETIDQVFANYYNITYQEAKNLSGQQLLVKNLIARFVTRILELDNSYAPFTLVALELDSLRKAIQITSGKRVYLTGVIDRVDTKDNLLRIVDYKTGADEVEFVNLEILFNKISSQKGVLQTLYYALLVASDEGIVKGKKLKPGLLNRVNIFDSDFQFGIKSEDEIIEDVTNLLPEFEKMVIERIDELTDEKIPFIQANDVMQCKKCEFNVICKKV
ncbi:MAG: PD-(D/E)XK nuclease family protein [Flavobacterium sp.]|nr:PD-(D/E)XK nuclease family protein [Flavobacterium sp.]